MPIQVSKSTGNRKRLAAQEAAENADIQALRGISPGQVGAWWDGLAATRKTAYVRAMVIYSFEQETRIAELERVVSELSERVARLGG